MNSGRQREPPCKGAFSKSMDKRTENGTQSKKPENGTQSKTKDMRNQASQDR